MTFIANVVSPAGQGQAGVTSAVKLGATIITNVPGLPGSTLYGGWIADPGATVSPRMALLGAGR